MTTRSFSALCDSAVPSLAILACCGYFLVSVITQHKNTILWFFFQFC